MIRQSNESRQKNKKWDSKVESNDSTEIPDIRWHPWPLFRDAFAVSGVYRMKTCRTSQIHEVKDCILCSEPHYAGLQMRMCSSTHTHICAHTHTAHTQTHTPDKRIHSLYWIDGCLWGTSERVFDGCVFGEYVMWDTVITTYTLHTHTCTLWLATDTQHSEQKNKYAI